MGVDVELQMISFAFAMKNDFIGISEEYWWLSVRVRVNIRTFCSICSGWHETVMRLARVWLCQLQESAVLFLVNYRVNWHKDAVVRIFLNLVSYHEDFVNKTMFIICDQRRKNNRTVHRIFETSVSMITLEHNNSLSCNELYNIRYKRCVLSYFSRKHIDVLLCFVDCPHLNSFVIVQIASLGRMTHATRK